MSPHLIVAISLLPSARAMELLFLTVAASSGNRALTLDFFWWSVEHYRTLGCNSEVH